MGSKSNLRAVVVCALFVCACGPSEKDDETIIVVSEDMQSTTPGSDMTGGEAMSDDMGGQGEEPADDTQAVVQSLKVSSQSIDRIEGATQVGVETVFLASILNGGESVVSTGTVTQQGATDQFTYSASPADHLVLELTGAKPIHITLSAFNGDLSQDASYFLYHSHQLDVRVQQDENVDFQIQSTRQGSASQGAVSGSVELDGVTYQVDLNYNGTYESTAEAGSATHDSSDAYTGTITAPGVSIAMDQSHAFKLIVFEHGVSNVIKTMNNTATINGSTYAFEGIKVRYETMDGWPNPTDYWLAEGTIKKDGQPIGQVSYDYSNNAWIELVVTLNGQSHELERFVLKQ